MFSWNGSRRVLTIWNSMRVHKQEVGSEHWVRIHNQVSINMMMQKTKWQPESKVQRHTDAMTNAAMSWFLIYKHETRSRTSPFRGDERHAEKEDEEYLGVQERRHCRPLQTHTAELKKTRKRGKKERESIQHLQWSSSVRHRKCSLWNIC